MSLLSPIKPSDMEGVKWAKLQRWLRQSADNAGITYTMSFPLTDILPSDSEGVKWTKLGAWMKLMADNIGGVGSGVPSVAGTANQVLVNGAADPVTGAATLSLPAALTLPGTLTKPGGAVLMSTNSALTDGAGAQVGTIANSPSAGNPQKWIAINDFGTTRWIPSWTA
jgi:hypothetical protein